MFVHVLCVEVPLHRSSLVAFMSSGMFKHAKDSSIKVLLATEDVIVIYWWVIGGGENIQIISSVGAHGIVEKTPNRH